MEHTPLVFLISRLILIGSGLVPVPIVVSIRLMNLCCRNAIKEGRLIGRIVRIRARKNIHKTRQRGTSRRIKAAIHDASKQYTGVKPSRVGLDTELKKEKQGASDKKQVIEDC